MTKEKKTFTYGKGIDTVSFAIDPAKANVLVRMGSMRVLMKKSDLWQMAWLISRQKEQDDLISIRKTHLMKFERGMKIQATKDIRKGEFIQINVPINIPTLIVESLLQEHGKELKDVLKPEDMVTHIPSPIDMGK